MPTRRALLLGTLAAIVSPASAAAEGDAELWKRLRQGGIVVLMRHASTEPGFGDPPGYRVEDCRTQRNLSDEGRAEARRVGERFRAEGVRVARVYTSPWCRCGDTARIAFGNAEAWEPLGSFFDAPEREPEANAHVRKRFAAYAQHPPRGVVVMVTHSVNIAALTKLSIGTAELVLVQPDGCCGLRVLGRLRV